MMSRAAQTHLAGRVFETPALKAYFKKSEFFNWTNATLRALGRSGLVNSNF
jgi:hypothetical protein